MDFHDLITRVYTTLSPVWQETMHAMFAARHVYMAWDIDLIGAGDDPASVDRILPLVQAAHDAQKYVSVPAMVFAATAAEYDPGRLLEIPATAPPNAVLGAILIDGDGADLAAFDSADLAEKCMVQSVSLARGLEARGMSTSNPALHALGTPFTWERSARLTCAPPTEPARAAGGSLAYWHAEWCARAYVAARSGESLPEVEDAPAIEV